MIQNRGQQTSLALPGRTIRLHPLGDRDNTRRHLCLPGGAIGLHPLGDRDNARRYLRLPGGAIGLDRLRAQGLATLPGGKLRRVALCVSSP